MSIYTERLPVISGGTGWLRYCWGLGGTGGLAGQGGYDGRVQLMDHNKICHQHLATITTIKGSNGIPGLPGTTGKAGMPAWNC